MFNPTSGSRWPLLVTLLAVAFVLLFGVSSGLARERISNGDATDTPGGDPVDSNDYGTGGGGSDDNVEDSYTPAPVPGYDLFRLQVGDLVFVILPDASLGTAGFTLQIVDVGAPAGEARYAP